MDKELRKEIAAGVRAAVIETMAKIEERWLTADDLCKQFGMISKEWLKKVIAFLAKHSFTVYMIHYLILEMIGQTFYIGFSAKIGFILPYVVCFACSVGFAVIFDLVLKWLVEKPMKKALKI